MPQKSTQNLQLNVVWLTEKIGLSVNQRNGKNTIPITNYFFWPQNDAWGQIDIELKSKPWIKESDRIIVLNNITQIIDYWKLNIGNETLNSIKQKFNEFKFIGRS